jgi:hypothetical protein
MRKLFQRLTSQMAAAPPPAPPAGPPNCFQQLKEGERLARAAMLQGLQHAPGLPAKRGWTMEQERELEAAVAAYKPVEGRRKWEVISEGLSGARSAAAAEQQFLLMQRGGEGRRKGAPWTEEEDAALEKALEEYVPDREVRKWNAIVSAMGTWRTAESVAARASELSELVSGFGGAGAGKKKARKSAGGEDGAPSKPPSRPWTAEDDAKLQALLAPYGPEVTTKKRCEEICEAMGRTPVACEQRHQKILRTARAAAAAAAEAKGEAGAAGAAAAAAAGAGGGEAGEGEGGEAAAEAGGSEAAAPAAAAAAMGGDD